jgi:hypothetical protein
MICTQVLIIFVSSVFSFHREKKIRTNGNLSKKKKKKKKKKKVLFLLAVIAI